MKKDHNLLTIPNELQIKIFIIPDYSLLTEIITIQEKINQLQSNRNYKIKKPKQKSFFEIQKALFPCFALTQTCKQFNNHEFKNSIVTNLVDHLLAIFPQGIALFLLPKPLQINVVDTQFTKESEQIRTIASICLKRSDFNYFEKLELHNQNNIIYTKSGFSGFEPDIESYTIIEYLLSLLSGNIAYAGRLSDYYPNTAQIKTHWEEFFIVLDYLCSLPTIDLSLPAAQTNKTIAQEINDQFNKYQYPRDLFSKQSQNKLNNPVQSEAVIQEQQFLLEILAQTYLGLVPESEQQEYLEYRLKKESEEKIQKFYEQAEKTKKEAAKKINFLKNLIKASIISILFFVTIICIFKKI